MKILFLGYAVSPDLARKLSGASVAGNKMQVNMLRELARYDDVELNSITVYPVAVFPRDKSLHIKKEIIDVTNGVKSVRVPFINLPVIKQFSQIFAVKRAAKKLVDKDTVVLTFNLFPQVGIPMGWLKKKYGCKTYCLLADLPIDDFVGRKGFSVLLRKLFDKQTLKSMQECDKYIVLNENVVEKYFPGKEYIVVDGGVSEEDIERTNISIEKSGEKNIVFCGALTHYNGIINLLDAFDLLEEKNIYLDIYGGGQLEPEVRNRAEKNKNIRYFGSVPNEVALKKQKEAWLLGNPRTVDDPISQVTFPSKTFEYLLSGTPILSTRINGYTAEYEKVMFLIKDNEPKVIAEEIEKISSMETDDLNKIANDARQFVISEKNWTKQTEKIHDFIIQAF